MFWGANYVEPTPYPDETSTCIPVHTRLTGTWTERFNWTMGNIPVVQETKVGLGLASDYISGDHKRAKRRRQEYLDQSVIGSSVAAMVHLSEGDHEKARTSAKGLARATGRAVLLGGAFDAVPGFQELSKCGASLGDAMAGDCKAARLRWTEEYARQSCIGSTFRLATAHGKSDMDELHAAARKAWARAGITVAVAPITYAAGVGAAGFESLGVDMLVGAAVGSGAGTIAAVAESAAQNGGSLSNLTTRDVVDGAVAGGVFGGGLAVVGEMLPDGDASASESTPASSAEAVSTETVCVENTAEMAGDATENEVDHDDTADSPEEGASDPAEPEAGADDAQDSSNDTTDRPSRKDALNQKLQQVKDKFLAELPTDSVIRRGVAGAFEAGPVVEAVFDLSTYAFESVGTESGD